MDNLPAPSIPEHELFRLIGRGSYGEVWLARNLFGDFRAAKIIYRDRFESNRPFLRELEGIKNAEPLTRQHEGLIDILQVGQFEGGFYYIMELADDAEHVDNDPTNYRPLTLQTVLDESGAFSPIEALDTARKLAHALAHFHTHDFVHRDIKLSNIIYHRGQPKLADVGLVAGAGDATTLVGTLGYIPLEGPGQPPADVYALGKVIYEIATGKDRADFPLLDELNPELAGLNEITLRACAENPNDRYVNALQLATALDHLAQTGAAPPAKPQSPTPIAAIAITILAVMILWWPSNSPTLPPLHSPSPTPPISVSQPVTADRHTLLIQHFEGNTTGTPNRPLRYAHGHTGQGLRLSPRTTITWPLDYFAEGTIEFHLKLDHTASENLIQLASANYGHLTTALTLDLKLTSEKALQAEVNTQPHEWHIIHSNAELPPLKWHKILMTWGDRGVQLFLNDSLIAQDQNRSYINPQTGEWAIGATIRNGDNGFSGVIDNLRISNIQRTLPPNSFLLGKNGSQHPISVPLPPECKAPHSICIDIQGNALFTDTNSRAIYRVHHDGKITVFAGNPEADGKVIRDGPIGQAILAAPTAISCDDNGHIWFSDNPSQIRRITHLGQVSSVYGNLTNPKTIKISSDGHIFVLQSNQIFHLSTPPKPNPSLPETSITAFALSPDKHIYFTEKSSHSLKRITPTGKIELVAGQPNQPGKKDGASVDSTFHFPTLLAHDQNSTLYIVDSGNRRIRKFQRDLVSTVKGFSWVTPPISIAIDQSGHIWMLKTNKIQIIQKTSN